MNIFDLYGIKEVANVTFYSITKIEDEEFYTPVLYFDTLKVSTLKKSVETVNENGGKANGKILSWNFGKDLKLTLEDALFSKTSLDMFLNGRIAAKMSKWTSTICKLNVANKYGKLNYSTKAYPSPKLTQDEWEIVFAAAQEMEYKVREGSEDDGDKGYTYVRKSDGDTYVAENRTLLTQRYYKRQQKAFTNDELGYPKANLAMPRAIISHILDKINSIKQLGHFENDLYVTNAIDRFEKCHVTNPKGFKISAAAQRRNLSRYYNDDKSSSYTIYYDVKTMLPLFSADGNGKFNADIFTLKQGTSYYKWTRTINKFDNPDTMLGIDIIINQDTFPADYKIVGETLIRNQKSGKDQAMQFILNRAKISSSTNIELKADSSPVTFSMDVDVLMPKNGKMLELRQFDMEEDKREGGFRIIPQNKKYSYTPTNQSFIDTVIDNNEIY